MHPTLLVSPSLATIFNFSRRSSCDITTPVSGSILLFASDHKIFKIDWVGREDHETNGSATRLLHISDVYRISGTWFHAKIDASSRSSFTNTVASTIPPQAIIIVLIIHIVIIIIIIIIILS
jgi:hypothetical protein